METLFERLLHIFSVEYIFTVVVGTYFVIKFIEHFAKNVVKTWVKKVITIAVGILLFWVFTLITDTPKATLLASYFLALFFYDYAIKWLLEKFDVNYKK